MKRALTATVAIAAVLLLAGCASAAAEAGNDTARFASEGTTPIEPTAAPLVAEVPELGADETAFVTAVRNAQTEFATQIPNATDDQLLAVGAEACKVLDAGTDTTALSLIEDETPNAIGNYSDTDAIITAAAVHLCS